MKELDRKTHWENAWSSRPSESLSWYQSDPTRSLTMIRQAGIGPGDAIIDVGAGDSVLAEHLLGQGFNDLTVLDVSRRALDRSRRRLGHRAEDLCWIEADVTQFKPKRRYAVWHDRAVFHFLVSAADRSRYIAVLDRALALDGQAIIASFALDGPERCSGLPIVRYGVDSLDATLGAPWRVIEACREVHETPGGAEQNFSYFRIVRTTVEPVDSHQQPQGAKL
jgi:hypothetical protein